MDAYIGSLMLVGYTYAPQGWLECAGQLVPISQYQALYSLIGTTYGGNGSTNFGIPDLRGRVPVGAGSGPGLSAYVNGEQAGNNSVTLNVNQMPAHNHTIMGSPNDGNSTAPDGGFAASGQVIYGSPGNGVYLSGTVLAQTGGSQPHDNIQPYLTLKWCICTDGIYPPRG